jgi:superfamily I DNA/RNA helicase
MNVLLYNELNIAPVKKQFEKALTYFQKNDLKSLDVKKMAGTNLHRAKLDDKNKILFRFGKHQGKPYILLLETILNHDYEQSRFLKGLTINESQWTVVNSDSDVKESDTIVLNHVNPKNNHFHLLDKILSLDEIQEEIFKLPLPIIIIGSAGSGKTALTLEKIKLLTGNILYVTLSSYLVENSSQLYFANYYYNDRQEVEFLSFQEYLQSIQLPSGKEIHFKAFDQWVSKYKHSHKIKDAYKLYEEFKGVITGSIIDKPYLSQDDYLNLGIKQSVFLQEERPMIYDLFLKYLDFLKGGQYYDTNLVAHAHLAKIRSKYDYVVVDEVQDLTNIQLYLILKSLKQAGRFILCGDSNQIVHPNFFSWANIKTMFYKQDLQGNIIRVLATNYRNTPEVTKIANQLLLVKNARFGSIDKESTYLVKTNSAATGEIQFLEDNAAMKQELNLKTKRSTKFAVLVMSNEQKAEARKFFETPLVFSVQEAKGLEYDNIILYNIISTYEKEFRAITEGVTKADLETELKYNRARDKSDKSLETYKFYINSLYVAMTRAVRNLYVVERAKKHDLLVLLDLTDFKQKAQIGEQKSSLDEWQKEARKLEMQGKQEQADQIRKDILQLLPVPWEVLTHQKLQLLKKDAFLLESYNKKAKDALFEYAAYSGDVLMIPKLAKPEFKYKRAESFEREQNMFLRNRLNDYYRDTIRGVLPTLQRYGVDHRNPYNMTPLMLAAMTGAVQIMDHLQKNGANPDLQDNLGRNAFQIALLKSSTDVNYAKNVIGKVYESLKSDAFKVKIGDKLVKIANHQAEYFMLHFMIATLRNILTQKAVAATGGFETADFLNLFETYPPNIIPTYRQKRSYLSSIFGKNEHSKDDPYNKKLWIRIKTGFYLPSPLLEVECDEQWVNIYQLTGLDELAKSGSKHIVAIAQFIKTTQKTMVG